MTRNIGITFAMSALMVAFLAAADDAPPAKGDKEPAKKQPADQPPAKDKDAKDKDAKDKEDAKKDDAKKDNGKNDKEAPKDKDK